MSEIDALQQRLTTAMDRIATGLGGLNSAGGEDTAALQVALDDERTANAQLTERVRKMTETQETALAEANEAAATNEAALGEAKGAVAAKEAALGEAKDAVAAKDAALGEARDAIVAKEAALVEAQGAAAQAQTQLSALDLELQRLRKANDQLRQSNVALRAANQEGVGEPDLINTSMVSELESLRAARAADVAEASSIISALTPLLSQIDVQGEEDSNA
ncbi:MAG: hypothetical protein ABJP79_10090 [Tateyamaria sp.]|uniref:hypothetical protein n=1 Tax=Tateyamaria sp. TaxID=1929288 RepID=UPI00329B8705